ncbi:MAG: beta-N-acetylhexosaminidase [Chitinophagales bacterium]|nr:beta-N-acetylhexosaminidase [Chitinophagales bacterium]MDW8274732.1 beta-N-acetylhexosaminidase [Chitinophagales bacterium]
MNLIRFSPLIVISIILFLNPTLLAQHYVIPLPLKYACGEGYFYLQENLDIEGWDSMQYFVLKKIESYTGIELKAGPSGKKIIFKDTVDNHPEAYYVNVSKDSIAIAATSHRGRLYALYTLLMLYDSTSRAFQSCVIYDKPAYPYRALHLDVARHFFDISTLKKIVMILPAVKINTLHLHLTDDQGWRVEIKKYPLLTQIGAWRKEKNGEKYGGYYTQQELKELVAFAQLHGVEIIPEIDVPGHFSAAIASYPFLCCREGNTKNIEVPSTWGIKPNLLCPTDTAISFLNNLLDELSEIFPSGFVHIGGDEAPKRQWRKSKVLKHIMKEKNIKNFRELHTYLINELQRKLVQKNKTAIVWAEAARSGVSKQVVAMSWLGRRYGRRAAANGHHVIMAPRFYCYFDYPQSIKDKWHRIWMTFTPLRKVYRFRPAQPNCNSNVKQKIIGGEAMLWTEFIKSEKQLFHQLFPRIYALSEALWAEKKDYKDFKRRLKCSGLYQQMSSLNK